MTLTKFIDSWLNNRCDYDNAYGAQCMDLIEEYNHSVIGAPRLYGNAVDLQRNPRPDYYVWHYNPLWYIPLRGSIAVWNKNVGGGYGHVAIVLDSNIMTFTSLDQNWPTGSLVHIQKHDYRNVAGFLVPKHVIDSPIGPLG